MNVLNVRRRGTSVGSVHYRKKEQKRGWCIWQGHKRHTNRGSWHTLKREKHRKKKES